MIRLPIFNIMIKPIRIQRSRKNKQVSPNGLPIVYVGRPSKWGNPFKIGSIVMCRKLDTIELVLGTYKIFVQAQIIAEEVNINELRGKNLSCWCKIGEPCHADVLLEIANHHHNPE